MNFFANTNCFDDLYTTLAYIRWSKFVKKSLSLTSIFKEALKSKCNAYFYCMSFKYKRKKVENFIAKQKDPKFAFLFYRDVPNCNKFAMRRIILKSNYSKYIVRFACEIDNSFLRKAESLVIRNADCLSALKMLRSYKFCNESKLIDIILSSNKPKHLLSLSKLYNKNENILNLVQEKLIYLKNFKHLTYLSMNNSNLNLSKVENFIKTSGSVSDVLFFANKVKESELRKLLIFA